VAWTSKFLRNFWKPPANIEGVVLPEQDAGFLSRRGLRKKTEQANVLDPLVTVSLHFNAWHSENANGNLVLFHKGSQKGHVLAFKISEELKRQFPTQDCDGVRERNDLWILRKTTMPAVLVEPGFLTGNEDAPLIQMHAFMRRAGEAIAAGVDRYVSEVLMA
jgi:N-acetylmuramoyl-L-alanine amidase